MEENRRRTTGHRMREDRDTRRTQAGPKTEANAKTRCDGDKQFFSGQADSRAEDNDDSKKAKTYIKMAVVFFIPGPLRQFAKGNDSVELAGDPATLREALAALWELYPALRDRLVTEQGELREHINIFVGSEEVRYSGGIATPISSECEISIVPAISGG